jgi:dihydrofolate reductase
MQRLYTQRLYGREKEVPVRKVIVSEFVTLDGVMEDPGGAGEFEHGGWSFRFDRGPEEDRFKFDELAAAGALLLGRVTYEGFAAAWPQMEEQTGEYGAWMNGYTKYVASTTLQEPLEWNNSALIKGDVAEEVRRLKEQPGKDILIDEYRLMVFPIVVGKGKRLFGEVGQEKALRLVDTQPVGPDGVLVLTYEPAGQRADG